MALLSFDPNSPTAFLGKGMAWPLQEDPKTGDFARAEGLESISQCIEHLIHISFLEIPGFERMGTTVDELLFENDIDSAVDLATLSIKRAIQAHERRVQLVDVQFRIEAQSNSSKRFNVVLHVKYRIRATGEIDTNVYPFLNDVVIGEQL